MINQYVIKDTDHFDQSRYPKVVHEITGIHRLVSEIQGANRNDIIISYLKDHSITTQWLEGNREIVKMLTSGLLTTGHAESLFESCRQNPKFRSDFEQYIRVRLQ